MPKRTTIDQYAAAFIRSIPSRQRQIQQSIKDGPPTKDGYLKLTEEEALDIIKEIAKAACIDYRDLKHRLYIHYAKNKRRA